MQIILSLFQIIALFGLNDVVSLKTHHTKVRSLVSKTASRHAFKSGYKRKLQNDTIENLASSFLSFVDDNLLNTTLGDGVVTLSENILNIALENMDENDFNITTFTEGVAEDLTGALDEVTFFDNTSFIMMQNMDMCEMMNMLEMEEEIGSSNAENSLSLSCTTSCMNQIMDVNCATECSVCPDDTLCAILSTDSMTNMTNIMNPVIITKVGYQYTKGEVGIAHVTISVADTSAAEASSCVISYTNLDGIEEVCNSCEICGGSFSGEEDDIKFKGDCSNIDSAATNINLCDPIGATFPGVFRALGVDDEIEEPPVDCSLTSPATNVPSDVVEDTPAPVEDTPAPVEDIPAPVEDIPAPVEATTVTEEISIDSSSARSLFFYAIATISTIISATVTFL